MAVRYRRGRVTTPDWTAEFVTDGRLRKCDPPLDFMKGWTDDEIRSHVALKGWKITRVLTDLDRAEQEPLVQAVLSTFPGAVVSEVRPRSAVWDEA